jgi:hypothetical protein
MSYELIELGRVPHKFLGRPVGRPSSMEGIVGTLWDLNASYNPFMWPLVWGYNRITGVVETVEETRGAISESLTKMFSLSPSQTRAIQSGIYLGIPSALAFGLGSAGYAVPVAGKFFGRFGWGFMALGAAGMAMTIYDVYRKWSSGEEDASGGATGYEDFPDRPPGSSLYPEFAAGNEFQIGLILWKAAQRTGNHWSNDYVPYITVDEARLLMALYDGHQRSVTLIGSPHYEAMLLLLSGYVQDLGTEMTTYRPSDAYIVALPELLNSYRISVGLSPINFGTVSL